MNREMFDILNTQGEFEGTATWEEIHGKGLLHGVVAAFIFKDPSKRVVLLQRRSMSAAQDSGKWNHSAGGHVLAGEKPDDAIRRELKEELFADNTPLSEVLLTEVASFQQQDMPGNREILHLYETVYDGPFHFDPIEVEQEPEWIPWDELVRNIKQRPDDYSNSFKNCVAVYMGLIDKLRI